MTLIDRINAELAERSVALLTTEQAAALNDPAQLEHAAGMLTELCARHRIQLPLAPGEDLGEMFVDEEEARQKAQEYASRFAALCIEVLASDENRSYGGNEYRLVGFCGPDAALAAACHPGQVGLWLAGREVDSL